MKSSNPNGVLSCLKRQERLLDKAADPEFPVRERLSALLECSKELDGHWQLWTTASLNDTLRSVYRKQDRVYFDLRSELEEWGICDLSDQALSPQKNRFLSAYFQPHIFPVLSPRIIDRCHPFPPLQHRTIYLIADLHRKDKLLLGLIPIPPILPDILFLPGTGTHFLRMEAIIPRFTDQLFPGWHITNLNRFCASCCTDQTHSVAVARLDASLSLSQRQRDALLHHYKLEPWQLYQTSTPLNLAYLSALAERTECSDPP